MSNPIGLSCILQASHAGLLDCFPPRILVLNLTAASGRAHWPQLRIALRLSPRNKQIDDAKLGNNAYRDPQQLPNDLEQFADCLQGLS